MGSANPIFPLRAIIRQKAKIQLLHDLDLDQVMLCIDEELFQELASTLLKSDRIRDIYHRSPRLTVDEVEDRIATELADTYRQVKQRQDDPLIQQLNSLL